MNPLLRGVLLAAILCVLSEAKPGIVRYCTTNDDCDLGFYCFSSYVPAICSPCIDCSRARKNNPANGCAQHSDECGPCVDGYTAQGIRCLEDEVPGLTQTLDSAVVEGGSDSLTIVTIISLSIGLVILLLLCIFYYNRWKRLERVRRQCPKSFGGEIPQTSASEECIGLASAPPATELEYERPEPYNRNLILNPFPPQRFMTDRDDRVRLINDQRQQADPFSAGNSYGQNTIDYMNQNQQPNSGDEDELDGDAEEVIAALLDIEMDEPGAQHVNPELPLAEVSINLENMHHDHDEEGMDFDEDGMVPRVGDEELEDGNANDSGFSNSTSTSGLDQIVPMSTAPPKVYHMQILNDFFANLSSMLPSQQPAQGDGLLPNVLPHVEEFQGGILQNVDVNNAELVVVFSEENLGQIVNDSGLSLNEDSFAHETSLSFENIGDD